MNFVAHPPAFEIEQPPAEETPVVNDGYFPDIDQAAVCNAARIPTSITPARLRAAIMTGEIDLAHSPRLPSSQAKPPLPPCPQPG